MIKVAVFDLGRGVYSALSINQKYPLSTTIRVGANTSKKEIERIIVERFHSQRNVWKTEGANLEHLPRRDGWKITWWPTSILWSQTAFVEANKKQTIVDEPGLHIEKLTPLKEIAKATAEEIQNEPMYMVKRLDSGFEFTPVTDDIIPESKISEYMKSHRK